MLKFLTLKFRNQSLNEVRPFEPQAFLRHDAELQNVERSEDEDEELQSINEEVLLNSNNNNVENTDELNIISKSNNCVPASTKRENISDQENQPPTTQRIDGCINMIPSGFAPMDVPSTTPNDCSSFSAEKRKWSQMNSKVFLHQLTSGTDSSSDDEIKELCSGKPTLLASSSPPGKVTVLSKHSAFCARVRPTDGGHGHSRKKHRVIICEERPWLNFEKMQQKTLSKKHMHSTSRPRVVRIRNISHSNLRPGLNCDAAIRSFRPIPLNAPFNLAPVEEPGCAF